MFTYHSSALSSQGVNPKNLATGEQLARWVEKNGKEEKGFVISETSEEDKKIICQLLDIPQGLDGGHFVKFVEGAESCAKCHRRFSFLDLVHPGFSAHKGQFMKDVLLGKYGPVINPNKPNLHKCYECDEPAVHAAAYYWCQIYSCPG